MAVQPQPKQLQEAEKKKAAAGITHANHPNPDCTTGSRIAGQRRKGTRPFACTCKQQIGNQRTYQLLQCHIYQLQLASFSSIHGSENIHIYHMPNASMRLTSADVNYYPKLCPKNKPKLNYHYIINNNTRKRP